MNINNIHKNTESFLNSLKKSDSEFLYYPSKNGLTKYGKNLSLGFSCFALKIYYMLGLWDSLSSKEQDGWIKTILGYQSPEEQYLGGSFVDSYLVKSYNEKNLKKDLKDSLKKFINYLPNYNFESNTQKLNKAVNAETKQAISTLYEVGFKVDFDFKLNGNVSVEEFLNSFDWSKPWNAGAQFSSICVFSTTQELGLKKELSLFIEEKLDKNTGSYFSTIPNEKREIINGAMKVISGLDWLNLEIHYPHKLIDFCLDNKPVLEGCDIVDYIYVLYKCSLYSDHRNNQILDVFGSLINDIEKLYVSDDKAFSYFQSKSQTHYYGPTITDGRNQADLHGTTLIIWALAMLGDKLKIDNLSKINIIKP